MKKLIYIIGMLLMLYDSSNATVYTVRVAADTSCTDGVDCDGSPQHPYSSISYAILNGCGGGNCGLVADMEAGSRILVKAGGSFTPASSYNIYNQFILHAATIDGDGVWHEADSGVTINLPAGRAQLVLMNNPTNTGDRGIHGFTINSNGNGASAALLKIAPATAATASFSVDHCTFNSADTLGNVPVVLVAPTVASNSVTISNCTFTATSTGTEPIISIAPTAASSTVNIDTCTFTAASMGNTHLIYNNVSAGNETATTISNCTMTGVTLNSGYDFYNAVRSGALTFSGNTVTVLNDGSHVINLQGTGNATTPSITISGNTITSDVAQSANTQFVYSVAGTWGAISILNNTMTINNTGNMSGIIALGGNGTSFKFSSLDIENNTIWENGHNTDHTERSARNYSICAYPGGIASPVSVTLKNNIIGSSSATGYVVDFGAEASAVLNSACVGAGDPQACCTGEGVGTCNGYDNQMTIDAENNEIRGANYYVTANAGHVQHGLYIGFQNNPTIKNNYLNGCVYGVTFKSNSNVTTSGTISGNVISNFGIGNGHGGIVITGASGVNIYNNTLYSSLTGSQIGIRLATGTTGTSGINVKNNIVWVKENGTSAYLAQVETGSAGTFAYNYYWNESGANYDFSYGGATKTWAEWKALNINGSDTTGSDTVGSATADPKFADSTNSKFYLKSGSPCLKKGINLGVTYQAGLAKNSTWPSSVNTINRSGSWTVGAYSMKKSCIPGSLILCGYK